MARKLALIIGNSQYEDAGLARLAAPDVDVRTLVDLLQTPGIGAFDEVIPLLNEGLATVRKAIARFFDAKHRDDLLLLYFSGHGVRDEQGHLYLAVRDTERSVLAGTAIEASYVTTRMDRSASKRLVLVLDCCHSGAFGHGAKAAQGASVGTASAFEGTGRGRVVLTATDSTQYAWEGEKIIGDVENSLFTHYLIEGLRTGAADRDEDGQITIDELYDYVYDHVLNETPKQTPGKWAFGQQGEIIIAQNPNVAVGKLPSEIEDSLRSTLPNVRFQIMPELFTIGRGRHEGRARAAREALERLSSDDSRKVASGAFVYLQALERGDALSEDEWTKRVRDKEEELSGRKSVGAQIEAYVSGGEAALERGALEDAREMVTRAVAVGADVPAVKRLQERFEHAVAERARLEEAERHIRELRAKIAGLIARANATTGHADAIALLNEALVLDPEHADVRTLLESRHRQVAEAEAVEKARLEEAAKHAAAQQAERERLAQLEGQLSEASRHLSRDNLTKAIVITEAVLRADPQNAEARTLHAKAQGAVEAKRIADEYAARKREREREIDDMLAIADASATPDAAVEILNDLLTKDPGNLKAQALLSQRQDEIAAARAEARRAESDAIRRLRREEQDRERATDLPKGFSTQPTVMGQAWRWLRGTALGSHTFRIASVLLIVGALSWGVLDNLNRGGDTGPMATAPAPSVSPTPAGRGDEPKPTVPTSATPADPGASAVPPPSPSGRSARGPTSNPTVPSRGAANSGTGRSAATNPPATGSRTDPAPPTTPVTGGATTSGTSATPRTEPDKSTGTTPTDPAGGRRDPPPVDPSSVRRDPPPVDPPRPENPKTTPPEPKVDPPAPTLVADADSLRLAVSRYEAALSSADPAAIKKVYPEVSERELRDVFKLRMDLGRDRYRQNVLIKNFKIDGSGARLETRIFHNGVDDRGKTINETQDLTLYFRWTGQTWVRVRDLRGTKGG
jgi:hypothetical protein